MSTISMISVFARFFPIAFGISYRPSLDGTGLLFIAGIEHIGSYILRYMTANQFFQSSTINR